MIAALKSRKRIHLRCYQDLQLLVVVGQSGDERMGSTGEDVLERRSLLPSKAFCNHEMANLVLFLLLLLLLLATKCRQRFNWSRSTRLFHGVDGSRVHHLMNHSEFQLEKKGEQKPDRMVKNSSASDLRSAGETCQRAES